MARKSPSKRSRKSPSFHAQDLSNRYWFFPKARLRFFRPMDFLIWCIFLASLLIFTLALVGDRGVFHLMVLRKQTEQVARRNRKLIQANREIRGNIFKLKTDPLAIERLAREELGLVKPEERVFKFAEP